jgi:hypothetical protein
VSFSPIACPRNLDLSTHPGTPSVLSIPPTLYNKVIPLYHINTPAGYVIQNADHCTVVIPKILTALIACVITAVDVALQRSKSQC